MNEKLIFEQNLKIAIYTPSLNFGGGFQFIIQLYQVYKSFGFCVKIIVLDNKNYNIEKFNTILSEDILYIHTNNHYMPDIIFLNSILPLENKDFFQKIKNANEKTKIMFITHSDVSFSNNYIEKYHPLFDKIITVNNYTIKKLSKLLDIDKSKFYRLINYYEKKTFCEKSFQKKSLYKKFGVISRFSEDKNIPMLIITLIKVFYKYPNYICYFIGTSSNKEYDKYLKYLCKYCGIEKNVVFTGYVDNVEEYYKILDFTILPSVSEGCSYSIIESMSFGLPVITSFVGGNHELIKNNVNGIIYNYHGIRDFEKKTIYIKDYNQQLSIIGYYIHNDFFKENFSNECNYKNTDCILPIFVKCKNSCNKYNKCNHCVNIENKNNIFDYNVKIIYNSISNMIQLNQEKYDFYKNNNLEFIEKKFNKNIYINQLLELIDEY
jgi:glycosyltransferase involved in cell wall biosynthesis